MLTMVTSFCMWVYAVCWVSCLGIREWWASAHIRHVIIIPPLGWVKSWGANMECEYPCEGPELSVPVSVMITWEGRQCNQKDPYRICFWSYQSPSLCIGSAMQSLLLCPLRLTAHPCLSLFTCRYSPTSSGHFIMLLLNILQPIAP